tara:strand:- start:596 stop:1738 length:1143 start_codon:yes stop_codon:yes gene_type:complete
MNFTASRASAIESLDNFIEKGLGEYSKLRNFDFGPDKRGNISCLSPYITHGIINEIEVIGNSLKKYSFSKNEKFIQEVLWRTYWKGWLELRPNVWSDYVRELRIIREKFKDDQNYKNAINGNTSIECFNYWVNELKENNYLHNHTRMWFASIWIFTLDLPWQLGAEFFLKYLYDGDVASNTLGWRWVAGIQTQGKHYLASEWNIKKFTNNRFKNVKINENASPKTSNITYSAILKDFINPVNFEEKNLLVFDNNLSFETTNNKYHKFKKIYLIYNDNQNREIKLSEKILAFKNSLIKDQKKRLDENLINSEIININEIKKLDECYVLYPCVGENLDYLNSVGLNMFEFIYRGLDQTSWKHCNKGFFNFKKYIPKIINDFF